MRCTSPVSFTSSTSTKEVVFGASVGGRVSQTRGVTFSAPNSTVWFSGISRWEMRPVTLSRAANTAMGFLTISARAASAGSSATTDKASTHARAAAAAPAEPPTRGSFRCIMPHTM